MTSEGQNLKYDSQESFIILDEIDATGGSPPDGRLDVAEKTFDRMLNEIRDRYGVISSNISVSMAFSAAIMTMSAAILIFVLSEWSLFKLVPVVIFSTASIVLGVVVEHKASLMVTGVQVLDFVNAYNHHNYELANHLLFNSKNLAVDEFERIRFRVYQILRIQAILFLMSLLTVLVMEVSRSWAMESGSSVEAWEVRRAPTGS